MRNTRKTLNVHLAGWLAAAFPEAGFYTGDEQDPEIKAPAVSIQWLQGESRGRQAGARMRLAQLEVETTGQDTDGAEAICEALLDDLGLRAGAGRTNVIPKLDLSAGRPGIPTGTTIALRLQGGRGWQRIPSVQQQARRYVVTLEVEYIPD